MRMVLLLIIPEARRRRLLGDVTRVRVELGRCSPLLGGLLIQDLGNRNPKRWNFSNALALAAATMSSQNCKESTPINLFEVNSMLSLPTSAPFESRPFNNCSR